MYETKSCTKISVITDAFFDFLVGQVNFGTQDTISNKHGKHNTRLIEN